MTSISGAKLIGNYIKLEELKFNSSDGDETPKTDNADYKKTIDLREQQEREKAEAVPPVKTDEPVKRRLNGYETFVDPDDEAKRIGKYR